MDTDLPGTLVLLIILAPGSFRPFKLVLATMGRKKNRARKVRLGYRNIPFTSKTSPAKVGARLLKNEKDNIGRLYPRVHCKRTDLKIMLTKTLGLPSDTLFIFQRREGEEGGEGLSAEDSGNDQKGGTDGGGEGPKRDLFQINRGTVVIINSDTLSPVLIVRCTDFNTMAPNLRDKFNKNISQSYLHDQARNQCDKHSSVAPLKEAGVYWGWMGCCGWRGASEAGRLLGKLGVDNNSEWRDFS